MNTQESPKLSYYSFRPGVKNFFEQADDAAACGCSGVELINHLDFKKDPSIEKAKRLREYLDQKGLCVPCYSVWIQFQSDPEAGFETIRTAIDAAAVLGAPLFHHTVGAKAAPDQPFADYLKNAVSVFRRTYEYAGERGMQTVIEPQGLTMNGVKNLSAFYEAVDRPIGAILDTGNLMQSGDGIREYLDAFGPLIRHVHIKDMLIREKQPLCPDRTWFPCQVESRAVRQTVVGHGDVDFPFLLRGLHKLDYRGYFSLEYDAPEAFDPYYSVSQNNFIRLWKEEYCKQ